LNRLHKRCNCESRLTGRPVPERAGGHSVGGITYPLVERWAVRKLELIGLLVHESPVVYLNPDGKLPTMGVVKEAKTRGLASNCRSACRSDTPAA